MSKHEVVSEQGRSYALRTVEHSAQDLSHLGNQSGSVFYRIPLHRPARPRPLPATAHHPPPLIPGPQTALVVGPSGEEIYCDKYGRIRLQFYWDRLGKKDENSSCWVRVAQSLAGSSWGTQFTPRIGMEVVVIFLEGDPDRPLVVSAVYNGRTCALYLPDNKTQSGIKTRSSPQGSASTFNELRFEDKKDSELVYMHAQKDFTREVTNDDTLTVSHDQTITIKNNRTETSRKATRASPSPRAIARSRCPRATTA